MATTTRSTRRTSGNARSNRTKRASNSGARPKSSNGRGTKSRAASSNGSRTRNSNRSKAPSKSAKAADSVKQAASSSGGDRAQAVSSALQKAKTPLLASGAALAGIAGAVAVNATRSRRRKVLGVSLPKSNGFKLPKPGGLKLDAQNLSTAVTDAAKRADRFGKRVSSVATTVQQVSETTEKAAKKA
jgi:hypothetical protein